MSPEVKEASRKKANTAGFHPWEDLVESESQRQKHEGGAGGWGGGVCAQWGRASVLPGEMEVGRHLTQPNDILKNE